MTASTAAGEPRAIHLDSAADERGNRAKYQATGRSDVATLPV